MDWYSSTCYDSSSDEELICYSKLWEQKKKNTGIKNLVLLKSGESIKIKVPMALRIDFSKYCF